MNLIQNNLKHNYQIYNSKLIIKNKNKFYEECLKAKERFDILFPNKESSTWNYRKYNIFSLTSGFINFYKLFYELKIIIYKYHKIKEPLWFQSWLNFHKEDEVLNWHSHIGSCAHGYISINPENTKTIFDEYEIKNKVGQIYIGDSTKRHKVVILKPFTKNRITIAFDVFNFKNFKNFFKKDGNDINISIFPL
jgi:hypothetical protein